jgi:hypothetical protein
MLLRWFRLIIYVTWIGITITSAWLILGNRVGPWALAAFAFVLLLVALRAEWKWRIREKRNLSGDGR